MPESLSLVKVESVTVRMPTFKMPAPWSASLPWRTVTSEMETVPPVILKTRQFATPGEVAASMIVLFAPAPLMTRSVLTTSSEPKAQCVGVRREGDGVRAAPGGALAGCCARGRIDVGCRNGLTEGAQAVVSYDVGGSVDGDTGCLGRAVRGDECYKAVQLRELRASRWSR